MCELILICVRSQKIRMWCVATSTDKVRKIYRERFLDLSNSNKVSFSSFYLNNAK